MQYIFILKNISIFLFFSKGYRELLVKQYLLLKKI
jgi:hypothetical protein